MPTLPFLKISDEIQSDGNIFANAKISCLCKIKAPESELYQNNG